MATKKDIQRDHVFSIATQLEPSWYQKICITETNIKGNQIRCMHFDSSENGTETCSLQGCYDYIVKLCFYSLFFALALLRKQTNRFLIFGLGGGWAPMFLRKHYPDSVIDIVEIDGAVPLAAKHMGFQKDDYMNVIIQSNEFFLKNYSSCKYDFIFQDIPKRGRLDQWQMRKMASMLKEGGVLVLNIWTRAIKLEENQEDINTMLSAFGKVHAFQTTKTNLNFICHGSVEEKYSGIDISNYMVKLWENLPNYKYKNKVEDKLKQFYITTYSNP